MNYIELRSLILSIMHKAHCAGSSDAYSYLDHLDESPSPLISNAYVGPLVGGPNLVFSGIRVMQEHVLVRPGLARVAEAEEARRVFSAKPKQAEVGFLQCELFTSDNCYTINPQDNGTA